MFDTLIVHPLLNVLALIYALIPGHNFGLSIIIFTVLVRLLMWPLVRKQLHHTKIMRTLQPELKRIKVAAKGDKQKEYALTMELYKERGISPFGPIGVLIVQIPVFLALYSGLRGVVDNPQHIIDVSYPFVRDLSWMKELGSNISRFDHTLLGVVDLRRSALPTGGGIYFPAMLIVAASAVAQYFQSKQLLPTSKDGRNLRSILKDAGKGKNSDQAEVNAAVGRFSLYFIPGLIFIFTVNIASALSLYWLTSGAVALAQQAKILGQDEIEMEKIADEPTPKQVIEGEVIATKPKPTKKPSKSAKAKAKRRKK